jgi:phosphopantothenoylcysteine decarboxylase / phosphopantothenate---cysteine ligase
MWNHPATQENLQRLRGCGVYVVNPDEGYLACGMTGAGRLAGQDAIVAAVREVLRVRRDLEGQTVLLTAGPTQEAIDPVRYLTNRSSGRMGYAVAEAAAQRGAKVILVSGPTALETPANVTRLEVRTAAEMLAAVEQYFAEATIAIFAAAVADYRPANAASSKIKRSGDAISLQLVPNTDILATLARKKDSRVMVGFAAETERVAENARKKLKDKNADLIVANDVTGEGAGFDVDTNVVTLFSRDGRDLPLPKLTKREVAHRILDEVVRLSASVKHQSAD